MILAVALVACRAKDAAPDPAQPSMKGWELYSWPVNAGREWRFALLQGTNRVKPYDEIRGATPQLHGLDRLLAELGRLPAGEFVFWCAPHAPGQPTANVFPLPPHEIVDAVVARAERNGLVIAVP